MGFARLSGLIVVAVAPFCCDSSEATECPDARIEAHVIEQFRVHGPMSKKREYFGYIFQKDGLIESAIARGNLCWYSGPCEVKTSKAAERIPTGATVLGEWHTHPHSTGSLRLSPADVHGANDNQHIRCYRAFFSTAVGDIITWDVNQSVVSAAMASAVRLGTYRSVHAGLVQVADQPTIDHTDVPTKRRFTNMPRPDGKMRRYWRQANVIAGH